MRHEAGHLVIDPVFASIAHRDDDADCFIAIDIDDCDCDLCSKDRGPIPILDYFNRFGCREKSDIAKGYC